MKTTSIPTRIAPPEPVAPAPDCPYEAVRLGVGLRARDTKRLSFLVVATAMWALLCTLTACGGQVDGLPTQASAPCAPTSSPTVTPAAAPAQSCTLVTSNGDEQIFEFSDPDTAAPVGTSCVSLGGGWFTCTPDACLVLPYTGTCPHCPSGGGE